LPDPKSQFGEVSDGLEMKNVDVFEGNSEYIISIWYISARFGMFYQ
jgi:hypothetical protein